MATPFKLKSGNKTTFKSMGAHSATDIYSVTGDAKDVGIRSKQFHADRSFTPTDIESPEEFHGKKVPEVKAPSTKPTAKVASVTPKPKSSKPAQPTTTTKPIAPKTEVKTKKPKKAKLPKNFNTKGSAGSTTPGYSTTKAAQTMPKDFNVTGSKGSTTPGYSTTKAAKNKMKKTTPKKITPKKITPKKITPKKISSKLPKGFNTKGSSMAGKLSKWAGKSSTFLGGKALGVIGMLGATSASADQPGTGKHGGKKQTKYNPKTGKYE